MKHEGTNSLFQYWDRLRGVRPVPKRTEIEPADIKHLLADTFILEQDLRGEAVFRLAGTRLCATYGRELKGFAFASLWRPKDRPEIARLTRAAIRDRTAGVIEFEGVSRDGRRASFELLLLPLDGGRESPRVLGSVVPLEKAFWLGADPIEENYVTYSRTLDKEQEHAFPLERLKVTVPPLQAPTETAMRNTQPGAKGRRIRHLVVLDGGRGR